MKVTEAELRSVVPSKELDGDSWYASLAHGRTKAFGFEGSHGFFAGCTAALLGSRLRVNVKHLNRSGTSWDEAGAHFDHLLNQRFDPLSLRESLVYGALHLLSASRKMALFAVRDCLNRHCGSRLPSDIDECNCVIAKIRRVRFCVNSQAPSHIGQTGACLVLPQNPPTSSILRYEFPRSQYFERGEMLPFSQYWPILLCETSVWLDALLTEEAARAGFHGAKVTTWWEGFEVGTVSTALSNCDWCNGSREGQRWDDSARIFVTVPNACSRCCNGGS